MGTTWFVLPAYNEGQNLKALIAAINSTMVVNNFSYRIIIIDDGSTDDTLDIIKELPISLPIDVIVHAQNMNLGQTIKDGLKYVNDHAKPGDIIITMDADNSHPPGLSIEMISKITESADLVIASRYEKGGAEIGLMFYRSIFSRTINKILQIIFPIRNIKDYTCGYRAYSGLLLSKAFGYYDDQFITEKGFTCMAEILIKLRPFIKTAAEVPLVLRYDLKQGKSKMKVIHTIIGYLFLIKREIGSVK
jgi:dolichol-phosphate mannosyltransferase